MRLFRLFRRTYSILITLILLAILGILQIPPSDISLHKQRSPAFDLARFFEGKTVAYGIFEDRFGTLRRQFRVEIDGRQSEDLLILDERFLYDDGETDQRIWTIKMDKKDGETIYLGTAEDIAGQAMGRISGNALSWRYEIDLLLSGTEMRVTFDDFIYQIDDEIALNRAYVSKWGIDIGSVTLVFLKDQMAAQKLPLDLENW